MAYHAVPTEKLCVPFGLHPVVERVSIFKHPYNTTRSAHRQDDFSNFGTKNSKSTLFEKTLKRLNIRHKLIKPYTPRHRTSNGNLPSESALTIIFSIRPLNRKSPDYFLNAFLYGEQIIDKPTNQILHISHALRCGAAYFFTNETGGNADTNRRKVCTGPP